MTNLFRTTTFAATLALLGLPALAQITPEQVVASLEGQGYTDVTIVDQADDSDGTTTVASGTSPEGVAVIVVYNTGTGEVVSATPAEGQTGVAEPVGSDSATPPPAEEDAGQGEIAN